MKRHAGWSMMLAAVLAAAPILPVLAADFGHYVLGDLQARTPGKVQPGLLLMGGGDRNFDAMHWFMKKAGNGHIVVLRASQGGEIGEEFFNEVGGIKSVETFVFKDREAATDPKILAALKRDFKTVKHIKPPCPPAPTASSWRAATSPATSATGAAPRWALRWMRT